MSSIRATTPGIQRVSTPLRNGGVRRSTSTPKMRRLAQAVFEAQACNVVDDKVLSKRKRRQWENTNLHEIYKYCGAVDSSDETDGCTVGYYGLDVEYCSILGKLFEAEAYDAIEIFRSCRNESVSVSCHKSSRRAFRKDEWADAEKYWLKVEARLRSVVSRALQESSEMLKFLKVIESVLIYFINHHFQVPDDDFDDDFNTNLSISSSLQAVLECPISVSDNGITVSGMSSSFHRLFLHAACQFYGLHSKSIGDAASFQRQTTVLFPRRINAMMRQKVSLVSYLRAALVMTPSHHLTIINNTDSTALIDSGDQGDISDTFVMVGKEGVQGDCGCSLDSIHLTDEYAM